MADIELALRGGAITLLLLLATLMIRDARHEPTARLGAFFALGVAAYVVVSASLFIGHSPGWLLPLHIIGAGNPVVFWLLSASLFDDEFTLSKRHFAAWIGLAAFGVACSWIGPPLAQWISTALALTCNVVALIYAIVGRSDDLIESRRKLRAAFIAAAALYAIAQISAEFVVTSSSPRTLLENINAIGMIAITFVFCLELLAMNRDGSLISLATSKRSAQAKKSEAVVDSAAAAAKQDETFLVSLKRLMETDKIYREEALSVASLADKLRLPDYRLRRLINQQLGYRNFVAFLNDYRLADVMTALSDRSQANLPVLTIALSAGYQSIGPFNRAFKAKTGLTPTEFRQQQLEKAERRSAA